MRKACLNVRQAFGFAALTDLMSQQPEVRSRVATAMCFASEGRNQDTCLPWEPEKSAKAISGSASFKPQGVTDDCRVG